MSSIQRYKKSGGFVQLLSLIEGFGLQKREKFLEMIETESPAWAKALRDKMLSLERIFTWPDHVAIEVVKGLPVKNMSVALDGLREDQRARMLAFLSPLDKRRMEDAMVDKPKPEEVTANFVKLVELARKMLIQGELRAEKFDEGLLIPEDFEAKLEAQAGREYIAKVAAAPTTMAMDGTGASGASNGASGLNSGLGSEHGALAHDVTQLQRAVATIAHENRALKDEVRILRDKLDQIRKIA